MVHSSLTSNLNFGIKRNDPFEVAPDFALKGKILLTMEKVPRP